MPMIKSNALIIPRIIPCRGINYGDLLKCISSITAKVSEPVYLSLEPFIALIRLDVMIISKSFTVFSIILPSLPPDVNRNYLCKKLETDTGIHVYHVHKPFWVKACSIHASELNDVYIKFMNIESLLRNKNVTSGNEGKEVCVNIDISATRNECMHEEFKQLRKEKTICLFFNSKDTAKKIIPLNTMHPLLGSLMDHKDFLDRDYLVALESYKSSVYKGLDPIAYVKLASGDVAEFIMVNNRFKHVYINVFNNIDVEIVKNIIFYGLLWIVCK